MAVSVWSATGRTAPRRRARVARVRADRVAAAQRFLARTAVGPSPSSRGDDPSVWDWSHHLREAARASGDKTRNDLTSLPATSRIPRIVALSGGVFATF